ncbi:hypothetical protein ZOD2009_04312 [Haladaptatus paucihalophilus DX253]|uniref:Uncharacterized protein n=1 Tax=Haladaptatus paucihalophilus DX253 TaxID=797209 RepID=E7QPZ2_HALPU|nr:hypothetical protein ZOD2009_04312 [Haladaptatus paucihalophilus DX253]
MSFETEATTKTMSERERVPGNIAREPPADCRTVRAIP